MNSAYLQTCKIAQMIDMQENKLKQDRNELENALERQKAEFREMIAEVKADVEKFRDYENKKKEDDYNKQIAAIIAKLQQLSEEMVRINEQEQDLDTGLSEYP